MKKVFSAILFSFVCLQSCVYVDSDENISPRGTRTETFDLRNFDGLEMGDAFQVRVVSGATFAVLATGALNDLDDLDIFVRDGKLIARYDNWRNNRKRMDIDIVMPDVEEVKFSGAVNARLLNFENLPSLDIELSGASRCEFEGSAREVDFELTGASRLRLSGNSKFLDGEISGASQLIAFDLPVEESDLHLSGASQAEVNVSRMLKVDASGASAVRYKGNPAIDKKLSGGSTLRAD